MPWSVDMQKLSSHKISTHCRSNMKTLCSVRSQTFQKELGSHKVWWEKKYLKIVLWNSLFKKFQQGKKQQLDHWKQLWKNRHLYGLCKIRMWITVIVSAMSEKSLLGLDCSIFWQNKKLLILLSITLTNINHIISGRDFNVKSVNSCVTLKDDLSI